jgi:hypothetical protein
MPRFNFFDYAVSIGSYIKGRRPYYSAQTAGHEKIRYRASARTFAYLQPNLYWLRTHSRVLDISEERDVSGRLFIGSHRV